MSASAFAQNTSALTQELFQYHRGQDVFFMFMLVAFLMMFIKRYEWTVAIMTLLVLSVSFPAYTFIQTSIYGKPWSIELIILGVVCSITLVIAAGTFLGQIKTWQFLVVSALFVPGYMFNEWFLFTFLTGVADAGGSLLVHAFAAYWGYGVILALRNKEVLETPMDTTVHSVSFAWLAAMLLWVLWPSFTTALLPPELVIPNMLITLLALMGSTLSAYMVLLLLQKKIDPLVYAYAMLAGGVAIGSTITLVGPWVAFVIGIAAGIVSCLSFLYLHALLEKLTGVRDVMGVHNLHGVPALFGAIIASTFVGSVQFIAIIGTVVIALGAGYITGFITKPLGKPLAHHVLNDAECFAVEQSRN